MCQSSQSDPLNTSLHSGDDHETDEEGSQKKTEPLAQASGDSLKSKVQDWIERIKMDAAHVWQSEDNLKYFRPQELNKLQKGFARSTFRWVFEQINNPDGISEEKLDAVYELYILQFHEIANVMGKKKKTEKVRKAIQKYEPHFRSGSNDSKATSAFPSLLEEISALDYGQDVIFHFLSQRPDIFQSR